MKKSYWSLWNSFWANDGSFMCFFDDALFIWYPILMKMFFGFLHDCADWQLGSTSACSFSRVFSSFNRPAHWMGRRLHFWRRTLLYQVSLPASLLTRPPWHQNLLPSLNLKHNLFLDHQECLRTYTQIKYLLISGTHVPAVWKADSNAALTYVWG